MSEQNKDGISKSETPRSDEVLKKANQTKRAVLGELLKGVANGTIKDPRVVARFEQADPRFIQGYLDNLRIIRGTKDEEKERLAKADDLKKKDK